MKTYAGFFALSLLTALCLFMVNACDMTIGLGPKVNTGVPVIGPGEGGSQPGEFLRGANNLVKLEVQQQFGITSVSMTIWFANPDGIEQQRTVAASMNENGLWIVNIDTSDMADGTIRGQVTAIDVDGNSTTTTDLIYKVKNTPPQIQLTLPRISGSAFDFISGSHPGLFAGTIFQGNDLMGIASDAFGIAQGYPQIRLWPARDPATGNFPEGVSPADFDPDGFPLPGKQWYNWQPLLDEQGKSLNDPSYVGINLMATQFRWPLLTKAGEEIPTGYYRFQIRVKDNFGIANTYPNRTDNTAGHPEDSPHLNQFIEMHVIASDNPVIRWSGPLPEHSYEGFPGFYNGNDDLLIYLTISSGNIISTSGTRARISVGESVNWTFGDDQFLQHISANLYRIRMSADDIAAMLGNPASISGDRVMHVETVDNLGNIAIASRPVIIDNTAPELILIEPAGLGETIPRVTSTVTFRGLALDNQRVVRIYYALGKTETDAVRGLDLNDTRGWIDTGLHLESPRGGHPHGSSLDSSRVHWSGTLSSWSWRFTNIADLTSTIANQNYFVTRHPEVDNLWVLPIMFRVVDVAGNVSIHEAEVLVDPEADMPLVFITSHTAGQTVGGMVRISGTAEDNEIINNIYMRIYKQDDARLSTSLAPNELVVDWIPVNIGQQSSAISWHAIINQNGELNPPAGPGRWIRTVLLEFRARDAFLTTPDTPKEFGPITSIYLDFDNTVPVIDTPVILRGKPSDFGSPVDAQANMIAMADRIIARHKNNEPVNPDEGEVYNPVNGTIVSGFVTMLVRARDESGLISIRLRSGALTEDLMDSPVITTYDDVNPWLAPRRELSGTGSDTGFEYTAFIPLNTDDNSALGAPTRFGSGLKNRAEPITLEFQVLDNTSPSPFVSQTSFSLRVDNRHPLGGFTGALNVINPQYTIAGTAWDHGPAPVSVQGIEKVVIYFSRPNGADIFGTPLDLDANESSPASAGWGTKSVVKNRYGTPGGKIPENGEGTLVTLPFFPTNSKTGITIDSSGASGGLSGSLGAPPLHNWHVNFNFAAFPSGTLTINYVIFDHAGNATYYSLDIFLTNNRPLITSVDLGTIIGEAVEFPKRVPVFHDPVESNFRVRNNNFSLKILAQGGTGAMTYDVAYVTRLTSADTGHFIQHNSLTAADFVNGTIPASKMKAGQVYTIADRGTVNWVNYGVLVDFTNPANPGEPVDPVGITFVASCDGSPDIKGRVFAYIGAEPLGAAVANTPTRKRGGWTSGNTVIRFDNTPGAASFDPANRVIPDSTKVLSGVNFVLQNDRYFIVRLDDSAGISNAVLVKVDVHNTDSTPPALKIAHFGQKMGLREQTPGSPVPVIQNFADRKPVPVSLDNSGYNLNIVTSTPAGGERRGYVQYYEHSNNPGNFRADISGRVIFRGAAADNNRIANMTVRIGGTVSGGTTVDGITSGAAVSGGTLYTIANWVTNGLAPALGNTIESMRPKNITNTWGFNVTANEQSNTMEFGHVVNWEFAWDSASFPGMVGTNIPVTFTVTDPDGGTASQTIRVNIVPYITEVVTPLTRAFSTNPSTFNRSALGWYPVRENDTITIKGFNLGSSSVTRVSLPGLADTANLATSVSADEISANIGSAASSGALRITVNGIDSINNSNNDTNAHYNQEPNGLNNNLLNDDRNMYVWQTGSLLEEPIITSPIMRMHDNSAFYLTYGLYVAAGIGNTSAARLNILRSPGTTTQIQTDMNRYLHMGMAIDGAGDWFVGASNMTAAQDRTFAIYARQQTTSRNSENGTHHRRLLQLGGHVDRVRIPGIFAQNTNNNVRSSARHATRVLISYFDSNGNNNAIFLHYGLVGLGTQAYGTQGGDLTATNGFGGHFPTDGRDGANTATNLFPPPARGSNTANARPVQVVADNTTPHKGGVHTAVGALSNGLPLIAWYDRTNMNLVFSFGAATPTSSVLANSDSGIGADTNFGSASVPHTNTDQWQSNAVIVHRGAGTHVGMAVDNDDTIHLAYYDVLNGGLYYARIPSSGSGDSRRPDVANIQSASVDTYLSAGTKLTINVREETHNIPGIGNRTFNVPYISYFHASFAETRNSIRVAWLRPDDKGNMPVRDGTFAADSLGNSLGNSLDNYPADSFTGAWEVMTLPASAVPLSDEFVSNGVPISGTFTPPGSGLSGGSLLNTILVGYMTNSHYEGAVLKYDIWK